MCWLSHKIWEIGKKTIPTTWGPDWDNYSAADYYIIKK